MVRKRSFIQSEPVQKPSDVDALSSFMEIGEDQSDEYTAALMDQSDEFTSEEESSYEPSIESYQNQHYPADFYHHGQSSQSPEI